MTTLTPAGSTAAGSTTSAPAAPFKVPALMAVFTAAAAALLLGLGRDGVSTLEFATNAQDSVTLPPLHLPVQATGFVVTGLAAAATVAAFWYRTRRPVPLWLTGVFALLLLLGFLVWSSADASLPVTSLVVGSVALSTPLIYGVLGGVLSERVGVINVAIEAQLLAGAFTSAVAGSVTGSATAGLLAAVVAGVLVSLVLGVFSINYAVNQVIIGIVLNVLVLGLTTFVFQTLLVNDPTLNSPPQLTRIPIPLLSGIPVLGPVLFNQTVISYLMYVAVVAVAVGLYRTRWGLRLRAVGEHPQAADTVGIDVRRTRMWNLALAGGIVGLGGSYFTIGSIGLFSQNVTSGAGFIALAAVIFGRWDPVRGAVAALLFGFATNLQNVLGILGSPVPSQFLLMLPYLATIFAVAGFAGRVRGPAAAGRPY